MHYPKTHGFTLVELSIVLVILGLLTGGILTGQSLIRAAELRSVTVEFQRYQAAVQSFRDKYRALPGDMKNATKFWGDDAAACADAAVTDGTPGTCNGNGDGLMNPAAAAGATGDPFQFWKQLGLAGLIEGTYSGVSGPGSAEDSIINGNVPASRLSNGGWSIFYYAGSGNGTSYALNYGNAFIFGADHPTAKTQLALLRPEEAWNIDTKIDDGKPARGKVNAGFWDNACAAADDGTHAMDDFDASYKLSDNSIQCVLYFRQLF